MENVQVNHAPKPHDYEKIADSYAKYQWADAYLFFTGIWAVKGSFLAFYDGLTNRLTYYRRAWWATIVITVLTYIGCLFAYAFLAGPKFKTSLKNEAIKYQFSTDVSTDVLSKQQYLSLIFFLETRSSQSVPSYSYTSDTGLEVSNSYKAKTRPNGHIQLESDHHNLLDCPLCP